MTIRTDSTQGLPQPGLDAAREGRSFHKFVNAKASLNAAATVLTDAGSFQDMAAGYRYVVTGFYYCLTTASDTVAFEIVTTAGAGGAGAVTARTPKYTAGTAATFDGSPVGPFMLDPPLCFSLDDDACIAMRVLTNDAGASVNCGFTGWYEERI